MAPKTKKKSEPPPPPADKKGKEVKKEKGDSKNEPKKELKKEGKKDIPPPESSKKVSKKAKQQELKAERERREMDVERLLNPPSDSEEESEGELRREGRGRGRGRGRREESEENAFSAQFEAAEKQNKTRGSKGRRGDSNQRETEDAQFMNPPTVSAPLRRSEIEEASEKVGKVDEAVQKVLDKVEKNAKLSNKEKRLYERYLEKEEQLKEDLSRVQEKKQLSSSLFGDLSPFDISSQQVSVTSESISIEGLTLEVAGKARRNEKGGVLIDSSLFKLSKGHRYGLVGENGSGKSALLKNFAAGRVCGFESHWRCFYVDQMGACVSELGGSILDVVMACDEGTMLNKRLEEEEDAEKMGEIAAKLETLDEWHTAELRARTILFGLGFEDMSKDASLLSGGWKMRLGLARGLFVNPDLLLLDEPTNHLDLEAVMWLEDWLCPDEEEEGSRKPNKKQTVLVVAHNVDFLDAVCTDTIFLHEKTLKYSRGSFSSFRLQLLQQEKKLKEKEKTLARSKNQSSGYRPVSFPSFKGGVNSGIPLGVSCHSASFSYSLDAKKPLLKDLDFRLDSSSKICIVGKNGSGKSTLLRLLAGKVEPQEGEVEAHRSLKLGWFDQHFENLPGEVSPLDYLANTFSRVKEQDLRKALGSFGLSSAHQLSRIAELSGGQKSRVQLSSLQLSEPHLMVLDEPTNHLDLDSVSALVESLQGFEGGLVVVTHDASLVRALDCEIWEVDGGGVREVKGGLREYRRKIVREVALKAAKNKDFARKFKK